MKALITELIWKEGINELEDQGFEVDYDETLWANKDKLLAVIPQYDAVIVRNQTKVNRELLDAGIRLKAVGRLGVGLDNIDLSYAKEKKVQVVFARHANATSVAEYVMTAILSASRPLHFAHEDVRSGSWNRKRYTGEEISQKTIGLVGLGEISHRVARRAGAFGMNVIGYDPFVADYDHIVSETGVGLKESLDDVLKEADFVSLHVPLTKSTHHLISTSQLHLMKSSSTIINTSRGGIIDEQALADALQHGEISGAYLDVLEVEPIQETHPLLLCENITITPHIAGLTEESQVRTSFLVAKEIGKVLKGEHSLCTV
ncbi:hydroxyacid dehydrogenase [Bacillus sp. NTK074B]|uniref:hydroxyacid dehydrogenase n=1 Tax=Bacillus sp. NTK074B TaxID=2802174 RepID=UPI001A8DC856|nr:hydroxyacid dehydrogenase [Bacillus sp. NTK074B]